jgi:DNA polymerase III subunit gamma/tau
MIRGRDHRYAGLLALAGSAVLALSLGGCGGSAAGVGRVPGTTGAAPPLRALIPRADGPAGRRVAAGTRTGRHPAVRPPGHDAARRGGAKGALVPATPSAATGAAGAPRAVVTATRAPAASGAAPASARAHAHRGAGSASPEPAGEAAEPGGGHTQSTHAEAAPAPASPAPAGTPASGSATSETGAAGAVEAPAVEIPHATPATE